MIVQKSLFRTNLTIFLNAAGIIQRELVPEGTKLNIRYYLRETGRRYARMRSVIKEQFRKKGVCSCIICRPLDLR